MSEQQKQHILDPAKVIAGAIASPVAALLTSRFGVAGTLLGLALSSVVLIVISDILKAYLAHASSKVSKIQTSLHHSSKGPYKKSSPLLSSKYWSTVIRSLGTIGMVFLLGLGIVTGIEVELAKAFLAGYGKIAPQNL